jgi:ABC-type sugar transport system ATPase subunit
LRRQLTAFAGPSIVVTHDPLEALVLADRILILEGGRIAQEGSPSEVARRPATEYVARLMGLNLYPGVLADPVAGKIELDGGGALFAVGPGHEDSPVATTGAPADFARSLGSHDLTKGMAASTTPAPPTTEVVAVRNRRRPLSTTASFAISTPLHTADQ